MNIPDYEDIVAEYGRPFITQGKHRREANPDFLAALFLKANQVKLQKNGTVVIYRQGQFNVLSERKVLNQIEEMGRALAKENNLDVGGLFPMSLLKEVLNKIKLRIQELDTSIPEDMIPCQNCILRWRTDKEESDFEPLDYSFELTVPIRLDVEYDPEAKAPKFAGVIKEILTDEEDRRVVQEYFGAALFSANYSRKFLLLYGEGGCGKSVLVELLVKFLTRKRVFDLQLKDVSKQFCFAALEDQTLLTSSEAVSHALCSLGGEWVKKAVGGDFFQTDQKQRNERIDHEGRYSIVIVSNNQLQFEFEGRGDEWRDRMIPIFFNHHVPEKERDQNLVEHLLEAERAGIFNWFLEGARRVRQNAWKIALSPIQLDRVEKLLAASHPLEIFVKNHVEKCYGHKLKSAEIWGYYVKIRAESGLPDLEEKAFFKLLAKAMRKVYKVNTGKIRIPPEKEARGYRHFRLKENAKA